MQEDNRIFFYWDDADAIPPVFKHNIDVCSALHRDWRITLLDDDALPDLLDSAPSLLDFCRATRVPAVRSDIARLAALYRYGGWYLDADIGCRRTLDEFDTSGPVLFLRKDPDTYKVLNGAMYFPRSHPMLKDALETVAEYVRLGCFENNVWNFAGPGLMTALHIKHGLGFDRLLDHHESFKSPSSSFVMARNATSTSWRLQQCFGIYERISTDFSGLPQAPSAQFVGQMVSFMRAHSLLGWSARIAELRPEFLKHDAFRALVDAGAEQGVSRNSV